MAKDVKTWRSVKAKKAMRIALGVFCCIGFLLGGCGSRAVLGPESTLVTPEDEVFAVSGRAGIPAEIWHLKTAYKTNWGKMPAVLARIDPRMLNGSLSRPCGSIRSARAPTGAWAGSRDAEATSLLHLRP